MRKLWKIALVAVFTLFLALPLALTTGCGETFTVNFEVDDAAAYGTVSERKVTNVKQNSTFSIENAEDGSYGKITIGGKTITATPNANTREITYKFDRWKIKSLGDDEVDLETAKVTSNLLIQAVFKQEAAVYTFVFDTNGKTLDAGQELPTDKTVTIGSSVSTVAFPIVHAGAYINAWATGDNKSTGWSLNKNATSSTDCLNKKTQLTTTYINDQAEKEGAELNINIAERKITLYAVWSEVYLSVSFANVTGYKVNNTTIQPQEGVINDAGLRIQLKRGDSVVYDSDTYEHMEHTEGRSPYKFAQIAATDLFTFTGTAINQKQALQVWVETSAGSGEMVNTGAKLNPTFSGTIQSPTAKVYYTKLDIETTEGVSVLVNGEAYDPDQYYIAGTPLTLTASVADGYTWAGWQVKSLKSTTSKPYPTNPIEEWGQVVAETEIEITIPSVYKSESGKSVVIPSYKASATANS